VNLEFRSLSGKIFIISTPNIAEIETVTWTTSLYFREVETKTPVLEE